jgi:hypothetical protein
MNKRTTVLIVASTLLTGCQPAEEDSPATATRGDRAAPDIGAAATVRRARGPIRAAPEPDTVLGEHPDEPRRAADEPDVFRSAGRPAASRVAMAATFQPGAATATPVWYGLLHAHTLYSDGSGTPAEAFTRARAADLDFLAVTSHNHSQAEAGAKGTRRDGILIATNTDLYDSPNPQTFTRQFRVNGIDQTEQLTADSVISAANAATQSDFVGLFGQEFSSISLGNHVNVIGAQSVINIPNGDFAPLYTELGNVASAQLLPVVQMNHPHIHKDLFYHGNQPKVINAMFNDYGFDEFDRDFADLVAAADPFISLIEVLTGPALDDEIHPTFHYPSRLVHDNDYYYYLIQGFHLSPSVGQDNHFRTWGDATPARMGIFAPQLTRDALLTAMRANHTFATEDTDLRLEFFINGQPMGSVLTLAADAPLDITVQVADPTEPSSSYVAELFYGDVVPQDEDSLEKWVLDDGLADSFSFSGDGVLTFDEFIASGRAEFFFARVQQGDGDRAWSAPVWINHARPSLPGN